MRTHGLLPNRGDRYRVARGESRRYDAPALRAPARRILNQGQAPSGGRRTLSADPAQSTRSERPGPPMAHISLPRSLEAGIFESTVGPHLREPALRIDLSPVQWLDVSALMSLVALVKTRSSRDLCTSLLLPDSRRVRDFLRAWNFPAGVRESAGQPFRKLVAAEHHGYFGEPQKYYLPQQITDPETGLIEQLVAARFFGFTSYRLVGGQRDLEIVEAESNRWRSDAIQRTLGARLHDEGGDLPRVVIFELMANVVQHPGARVTSIVSYATPESPVLHKRRTEFSINKRRKDTHLTICVWDDGTSIPQTLRSALLDTGSVRLKDTDSLDVFSVLPSGWVPSSTSYPVSWTPTAESNDAEFLISSLFPGITQKAGGEVAGMRADFLGPRDEPGMGLHALYKVVIDQFGGMVSIRTGNFFLNLRKSKLKTDAASSPAYRVKVRALDPDQWIDGTMFSLRLPLD